MSRARPASKSSRQHESRSPGVAEICAELDTLAGRLCGMWSSAMGQGDFDEVTRVVEATHAVQRAIVALCPNGPMLPAAGDKR